MASQASLSARSCKILGENAEWRFQRSMRIPEDLERHCKPNSALVFEQQGVDLSYCILVSAGCSHVATVEVSPSERRLKVTVYSVNGDFNQKWSASYLEPERDRSASESLRWSDTTYMHGGITEDGDSVLLMYQPVGTSFTAYLVDANGFTSRKLPSSLSSSDLLYAGRLSQDSEHILYTRSATPFGKHGEAQTVEAYSIRHLALGYAVTFGFGDGYHLRNVYLLSPPRTHSTMFMAINTASFHHDDQGRDSPPLIASSDGKSHSHFSGIHLDEKTAQTNIFVSGNNEHLFYIEPDTATAQHWNLKSPSLKPLGSVRLLGVDYSQARRWLIHGKETTMRDAIAEQIHYARFSPNAKVVTIVTVNRSKVAVNILLTSNLQLVWHKTIKNTEWPDFIPMSIGFNEHSGLNVLGMFPTQYSAPVEGVTRLWGVSGALLSLRGVYEGIRKIEEYFDSTESRVALLKSAVHKKEAQPLCRYSWKPGVMDRNDQHAIPLEHGRTSHTTAEDSRRQKELYETIFLRSLERQTATAAPGLCQFLVPHLFSFQYPWDAQGRVSVFGIIMENEYHIVVIGQSPQSSEQRCDILRILYASEIKIRQDAMEHIEIYQCESSFILRVSTPSGTAVSYSGTPMPIPRWTIVSPHFLQEDDWYDTFILHRSKHVTMPTRWSVSPNPALTMSGNFSAFFRRQAFGVETVMNYGHRAQSAHALPKYILWLEYGLRGLQPPNPNAIFFGGGRYADILGPYLRAIYEDPTYDESTPLFPSTFALACNADLRAESTQHVDAFLRRFHQEKDLVIMNTSTIGCALSLACRAHPVALLSFMRHLVLYPFVVNDIGGVGIKYGSRKPRRSKYDSRWYYWRRDLLDFWYYLVAFWGYSGVLHPEPNLSHATLPLSGFCCFRHQLYKGPPPSNRANPSKFDSIMEFCRAATPAEAFTDGEQFPSVDAWLLDYVKRSSSGPTSPFTHLVQEILEMKDRDTQLSFLRIVWLEKLLSWKMKTFGLYIYLTRTALPMLMLFCVHLTNATLLTGDSNVTTPDATVQVYVLAGFEALISAFILTVKVKQLYRIPRLFIRSIFTYIDTAALTLGFVTFIFIVSKSTPPRPFLAFSTLLLWVATILMLRIYKPVGMLLLLLTETLQGVFSYLVLLFFIMLGSLCY